MSAMFDAFRGQRLPGGCPDCDAYQTVKEQAPSVYVLTVHHDDTCPRLLGVTT